MARLRGRQLAAFLLFSTFWSGNWLAIRVGVATSAPAPAPAPGAGLESA